MSSDGGGNRDEEVDHHQLGIGEACVFPDCSEQRVDRHQDEHNKNDVEVNGGDGWETLTCAITAGTPVNHEPVGVWDGDEECEEDSANADVSICHIFTGAARIPNRNVVVHNACRQFRSGGRRGIYGLR